MEVMISSSGLLPSESTFQEIQIHINKNKWDGDPQSGRFRDAWIVAKGPEKLAGTTHKVDKYLAYYVRAADGTMAKKEYGNGLGDGSLVTISSPSSILAWNFGNGDRFEQFMQIDPPIDSNENGATYWAIRTNIEPIVNDNEVSK